MYAQLLEARATPELDRLVADDLVRTLFEAPGFAGLLGLVDRDGSQAIVIVLWETAEQAQRPPGRLTCVPATSVSIWEVKARV